MKTRTTKSLCSPFSRLCAQYFGLHRNRRSFEGNPTSCVGALIYWHTPIWISLLPLQSFPSLLIAQESFTWKHCYICYGIFGIMLHSDGATTWNQVQALSLSFIVRQQSTKQQFAFSFYIFISEWRCSGAFLVFCMGSMVKHSRNLLDHCVYQVQRLNTKSLSYVHVFVMNWNWILHQRIWRKLLPPFWLTIEVQYIWEWAIRIHSMLTTLCIQSQAPTPLPQAASSIQSQTIKQEPIPANIYCHIINMAADGLPWQNNACKKKIKLRGQTKGDEPVVMTTLRMILMQHLSQHDGIQAMKTCFLMPSNWR